MKKAVTAMLLIFAFTAPAQAQWDLSVEENEFTYEVKAYATSPQAKPTKQMPPPYTGTAAWISFVCSGEDEWVFINFNNPPVLKNSKIIDGHNEIKARITWDNTAITTTLTQEWGSKYIQFLNDDEIVNRLIGSSRILIELEWYTAGNVYFPFSLTGSSKTIYSARKVCSQ